MSPKSDAFLTASEDRTCRLWDLRSAACTGVMRTGAAPATAWDHQGLVFGVVTDDGIVKMFDAKSYDQGPFVTFTLPLAAPGTPPPKATVRVRVFAVLCARSAACLRSRRRPSRAITHITVHQLQPGRQAPARYGPSRCA
jgi:WD40 repeat protein